MAKSHPFRRLGGGDSKPERASLKSHKVAAYFIRHGTTNLNQEKKFRGPLNPDLDAEGRKDARALKSRFSNVDTGNVYTSSKTRSKETAHTIFGKKPVESTPSLDAWNVGFLAGKPKADNEDTIQHYQQNPDEKIPEGESLNDFRSRVHPTIKKALKEGVKGKPSAVVTHSSVIHELGNMLHGDHKAALVDPGGVVEVTHDGKKYHTRVVHKPDGKETGYGS